MNQIQKITHFGYEYDDLSNPHLHATFKNGELVWCLPEIHVWLGHVEDQEIVDLTIGYQPSNCERLIHKKWKTPKPDDFLWGKPKPGWIYKASEAATRFAVEYMRKDLRSLFL